MKALLFAAILGCLVAAVLAIKIPLPHDPSAVASTPASGSAFKRVISTGTLRCAYASYDPFLIIGPDGKQIGGIFHDVVEEAAKRLNLKVQWVEEVGYGNINTGFATGRYDAFCAGLWPAGSRAASTIFSRPVIWDPISVWVRGDDIRFDGQLQKLDDPAYKIADTEGDATVSMADALFPKAGRATVGQNQTIGDEIEQVMTGKADAMFRDYISADRYMKDAPGKWKDLSPGKPVLTYPITIGFAQPDTALRDMFDVVLGDMDRDGSTARIVKTGLGDKAGLLYHQDSSYVPY